MSRKNQFAAKWNAMCEKLQPTLAVLKKIGHVIDLVVNFICDFFYKLRKIILLIPVVVIAIKLAKQNMERLPESVGINFLSNGEFQHMIPRDMAVYGPLAVTAFCLLLMLCSRRVLNPWIVSVFSLIIPLFLWISNSFPA